MHHPGPPRFVGVGSAVELAPRDPDPEGEYEWRIAEAPTRSRAILGDAPVVEFVPDEPGTYTVALDAPDGPHRLTVRAFPSEHTPPKLDPVGTESGRRSGSRSGSDGPAGGGQRSGSGVDYTTLSDRTRGNRPRIQLFGHVEGDEVVLTTNADPAPESDLSTDDVRVEFYPDDRDPVEGMDLAIDGTDARIPVDALGEYSRVHAVAVGETFSVADTVAISVAEEVTVERLNEPPKWSKDVSVYEIYVRTFTGETAATFEAFTERLPYLKRLGVDCIWLTPVLQNDSFDHGYNITDFFSIADDLGTREDFEAFVEAAHDHGMSVLFDLVLNHSAREHPYFERAKAGDPEYRDWYEWADEENDVPGTYFGWQYIANFNFENLEVRRHLLDVVDKWMPLVDGFRCDMAWAVPNGFWKEVRDRVKTHDSEFLLLDETIPYVADFHELCFDIHFDNILYDAFRDIGKGADASILHDALENRAATGFPDHAGFLLYFENHDEERYPEECGRDAAFAAAGAIFTLPGIPLIYAGQEIAESTRRDAIDWDDADEELRDHYRSLVATRKEHPALGYHGRYEPVDVRAARGVIAYAREYEGARYVVVLNFGVGTETASVPDEQIGSTNLLDGNDVGTGHGDIIVDDIVVLTAEP